MKAMSQRKMIKNGMSARATRLPELKNSRRASNPLRLLTSPPVESGLASMRRLSTLLISLLESTTSALRPAISTK